MFVLLNEGCEFTNELTDKIRKTLREKSSRRHVPKLIFEAPPYGIPYIFPIRKLKLLSLKSFMVCQLLIEVL